MGVSLVARFLVVATGGRRFALPIAEVERACRRVAIEPLPGAPAGLLGVIDVGGELWSVVDFHDRLALPPAEPSLGDRLVLLRLATMRVAIVVQAVEGVVELGEPLASLRRVATQADEAPEILYDLARALGLATPAPGSAPGAAGDGRATL